MAGAQFSWAAAADVATGIAGAISSYGTIQANKIIAEANAKVAKANAEAANTVRKAQNQQRASGLSLAATMRSITDQRILGAAGDATNNAAEFTARTHAVWTRGNVEQGLRDMEQFGAVTARAAAAGVGGASVNAVSYSMRLQQARLAERRAEKQDETDYEFIKQRSGIMPAAMSRMDLSPLAANFDYSQNFYSPAPTGGGGSLTGLLIEGLLRKKDSLQVALDSLPRDAGTAYPTTGDFARMDRGTGYDPISIN